MQLLTIDKIISSIMEETEGLDAEITNKVASEIKEDKDLRQIFEKNKNPLFHWEELIGRSRNGYI